MNPPITPRDGDILLPVHVQPRASSNAIVDWHNGRLKLKLTSPPVDGAANKLCIKFLAKSLGLSPSRVSLEHGATSRDKVIRIEDMSPSEFELKLKPFLNPSTSKET